MIHDKVEIYFDNYLPNGIVCFDGVQELRADLFHTDMSKLNENTTVEVELVEGFTARAFYDWCETQDDNYIKHLPNDTMDNYHHR